MCETEITTAMVPKEDQTHVSLMGPKQSFTIDFAIPCRK